MTKINLLPWREERRQELKRQFILVLAAACVVGAGTVYVADVEVSAGVEYQHARNEFIRNETRKLDKQIAEIAELKKKRESLVERMTVIQNLQGNRPLVVHVFDELVRTVPDGVYYKSITQHQDSAKHIDRIDAVGMAESNTRISNLMRAIASSDHFADPALANVAAQSTNQRGPEAKPSSQEKAWSEFNLSFKVQSQSRDANDKKG